MLKDTLTRSGNFKTAFAIEHDDSLCDRVLSSGRNSLILKTVAGPVGVYMLQQLSVQVFNKKLDFLAEINNYR
jgi:hypothetical protein